MGNNSALVYTRKEAAEAAKVSLPTIDAWIHRSDFPCFKAGRKWIIPAAPFREWLEDSARNRKTMPGV